jgi:hypothetical protein
LPPACRSGSSWPPRISRKPNKKTPLKELHPIDKTEKETPK